MNCEEIRKNIRAAFPLQPAPKCKLRDAVTADNWGVAPNDWPHESWNDWSDISDELLNKAEMLLTYFNGEVLVYFLPRFVVRFLDEGGEHGKEFSHATISFIFHLQQWHGNGKEFREIPLSTDQRAILKWVFQAAQRNTELADYAAP